MVVKRLSSEEARTHLRDVLDEVTAGETEIVIERHGKPTVVVISYQEYQRIQADRAQQRAAANYPLASEADPIPATVGLYADYWNQFIGAVAGEPWERPAQGEWETREAW